MSERGARKKAIICILVAIALFVPACGGGGSQQNSKSAGGEKYEIPPFRAVEFDPESSEGNGSVSIDLSHSASGYFGVLAEVDEKLKLQVIKDDENYVYDLPAGKAQFFPFQLGDGIYSIRVMQNVSGDKYSELYGTDADVRLDSEFEPFLRSNQYASYDEDSECVKKARSIAESASDTNAFITGVYDYICSEIGYDTVKAENVKSGYIPDPDAVMSEGKGICFDYASLAASMLRSQGVPVRIIFGYVGSDSRLYHAWNMYYTEEDGWVAVEFKVDSNDWNRLDLTFSANGEDSSFIGDGSNYTDVFVY